MIDRTAASDVEKDEHIERHNQYQRDYFGRRIKRTMRPGPSRHLQRQIEAAISFGDLQPGELILDVGCGMGRHAFLLAERGFRVEGLELSPFLIERLRHYDGGRYQITVHCGDIHRCPKELYGRYDALVGFFVLHHLADLERAFMEMAKLLRPGGRVIFIEPNPYNPLYYLQILITPGMSWQAEKGLLKMRAEVISSAMRKARLKLTAISRYGFLPPFLANRSCGAKLETRLERVSLWRGLLPFQIFRGDLA
jgi:SAM-dependent methyltransferase